MGSRSYRLLAALAFIAFVSLGLPDTVLGVAWPSIRATFSRPLSHLGLLLAGGAGGYLASSFLAGQIVRILGVGRLLAASSLVVTVALAGTALAPAWGWMIACAILGGIGAGAIDAGINAFAAARFSPRLVNWMHASWGIGATIGPLVMTAVVATHVGWRAGYGVLAAAIAALTVFFALTVRLWSMGPGEAEAPHVPAGLVESLRQPRVMLQVVTFFLYTGTESTAGQLLYSLFTEARGIPVATAGLTVSAYWGALTVGRIVFGQLAATLRARTIVRIGLILAPIASLLILAPPAPWIGLAGAVLLGFGFAPVFPTLISLTPRQVGQRHAAQSVGFQVSAATAGIMVFPSLASIAAKHLGLEIVGLYLLAATGVLFLLHEVAARTAREDGHV